MSPWHPFGAALAMMLAALLSGCAGPELVEEHLESNGTVASEFSVDEREIVLSARFDERLSADDVFMVEWLFPDGNVYLRKPVRRSAESDYRIGTSIPVSGKAPARNPGIWRVRLSREGRSVSTREFAIRDNVASGAAEFAGLGDCGPSRWSDAAISARRVEGTSSARPGVWVGGDVLEAAGATYSSVVLLTGCAPG